MNNLVYAVAQNDISRVELLLNDGADPNTRSRNGQTLLMSATYEGWVGMVELLLRYGANPNTPSSDGMYPLVRSISMSRLPGMIELTNLLLAHGADASTALQAAVDHRNADQFELLLAHGADVNTPDWQGCTPFWSIMVRGNPDWIRESQGNSFHRMKRLLMTHYAKISSAPDTPANTTLMLLHIHCVHKNQPIPADFTSYIPEGYSFTLDQESIEIINRYRPFLNQDREHTRNLQQWMKQRLIYYYLLFSIKRMTVAKILDELVSVHSYTEAGAKVVWDYITSKYSSMSPTMITHLQRLPDDLLHTLSTFMAKDIEYSFDDFPGMYPCCTTLHERFGEFTPV